MHDAVVRLSAIDGAVVLSYTDADPEVLQFGAKITAQQKEQGAAKQFKLVEFPCKTGDCSGWDGLENLGGTRHQSAARLAARCPDVAILVVSQDGRASLMAQENRGGVVQILRGFERALSPETTLWFGSPRHLRTAVRVSSSTPEVSGILPSNDPTLE